MAFFSWVFLLTLCLGGERSLFLSKLSKEPLPLKLTEFQELLIDYWKSLLLEKKLLKVRICFLEYGSLMHTLDTYLQSYK